MPKGEWLSALQAGDEVVVHREREHYVLAKIVRVTPTGRITVDEGAAHKSQFSPDGSYRAVGGKIFRLLQATPENREKAERHRIMQRVWISAQKLGEMPLETLGALDAALDGGAIRVTAHGLGARSLYLVVDDKGDGCDGIVVVTAATPEEATSVARPLMIQGAHPRARRIGDPDPSVATTDVLLYTTPAGTAALSPDEGPQPDHRSHPRLHDTFLGGPVAPKVRRHNAYVVGWEDGARDDRTHYLGGVAFEPQAYRRGFEDGTKARAKAWATAKAGKEIT
jgi:hypothetical protein